MKRLILMAMLGLSGTALSAESYTLDWMNHGERPGAEKLVVGNSAGKVYVTEAWFNGCPYCHENAPLVDKLAETLADDPNIVVIDLGHDRRDSDYRSWINRHHPNHPVVRDGAGPNSLLTRLGVYAYPTTTVLDCNLRVKFKTVGSWQSNEAELNEAAARAASAEGCAPDSAP